MGLSNIEWCIYTFNPWRGCTKVSPGCANCYAEVMSGRNPGVLGIWGPKGTRVVAAESYWNLPLQWNRKAKKLGKRLSVFCASLADICEDWSGDLKYPDGSPAYHQDDIDIYPASAIPVSLGSSSGLEILATNRRLAVLDDARTRLKKLIEATPNLDWLLLTKRPENYPKMFWDVWPNNAWAGTSVEDQKYADIRIPYLLKVNAKIRFLSCEPLLGSIDLDVAHADKDGHCVKCKLGFGPPHEYRGEHECPAGFKSRCGLHWVIVGGESGKNARPMHPAWVRSLRDQCFAADINLFFKQWGEWRPPLENEDFNTAYGYDANPSALLVEPRDGTVHCFIPHDDDGMSHGDNPLDIKTHRCQPMLRVGKKAAGREIDGRIWDEIPDSIIQGVE